MHASHKKKNYIHIHEYIIYVQYDYIVNAVTGRCIS